MGTNVEPAIAGLSTQMTRTELSLATLSKLNAKYRLPNIGPTTNMVGKLLSEKVRGCRERDAKRGLRWWGAIDTEVNDLFARSRIATSVGVEVSTIVSLCSALCIIWPSSLRSVLRCCVRAYVQIQDAERLHILYYHPSGRSIPPSCQQE